MYLDSPLAIEATKVFTMNMRDCFDKEAMELVNAGINPLVFPGLHISTTSDDSKMINFYRETESDYIRIGNVRCRSYPSSFEA